MGELILKRASASRPSGEWNEDDFDVLADGVVVGRILQSERGARRLALDVDVSLRASRRSDADARLCRDTRGRDGRIREKLAANMTGSCIAASTIQQFFALRD
jgi:hypothetical protein